MLHTLHLKKNGMLVRKRELKHKWTEQQYEIKGKLQT